MGTTRSTRTGVRRLVATMLLGGAATVVIAFGSTPATAGACDAPTISFQWGGQTNGDGTPDLRWNNADNWDQGRLPTLSDSVCIAVAPAEAPVVTADAYGGVIDAAGTELEVESGTLRVGESLTTGVLRLSGGAVGGGGTVSTAGLAATGGTVATTVTVSGPGTATATGLTVGSSGRLELAVDATLATTTVQGGGELVAIGADTDIAASDLDLAGTLGGQGALVASGVSTLTGDVAGSVRVVVPSGGQASVAGGSLTVGDDAVVRVAGTLVQDAQWVYLADRSRVEVPGTWRMVDSAQLLRGYTTESAYGTGLLSVEASGRLEHTGTGAADVRTAFVNAGTVAAQEGTLGIAAECPCGVSTGAFTSAAGATLSIGGATAADPLPLDTGSTLTAVEIGSYVSASGRIVATDTTFSGHLAGPGTFVAQGTTTASGGTLAGTGTLVVPGGSVLDVPVGQQLTLAGGRAVVLHGNATIGGTVHLAAETAVDVRGAATVLADSSVGGDGLVLVNGTLIADAGVGTAYVDGVDNEGTIRARSGVLQLTGLRNGGAAYDSVLTGGRYIAEPGGTLRLPNVRVLAAEVVLEDPTSVVEGLESTERVAANGVLRLRGGSDLTQAWAPLVNNGLVDLGPGSVLTPELGYTQLAGGTLRSSVTAEGLGSIAGPATLDGRLVVVRDPAYRPAVGTIGQVVDSTTSLAGSEFDVVSGLDSFDDRHLVLRYLDDAVELAVETGPAAQPAPAVEDLETTMTAQSMTLSWDQPAEVDRTVVVRRTSVAAASSVEDGTVVCSGSAETCTPPIRPGTTYSFTVFPIVDGVAGDPTSVVRNGSRIRMTDRVGASVAGVVRDVRSGERFSPPRVTIWTRSGAAAAWVKVGAVPVADGRFRAQVPPRARWIKVASPGVGKHLPARRVLDRR